MSNENDDTEDSPQYSVIEYFCRDAANWKTWGKVLLRGAVTVADLARIESKLEAGEFFIPEQIGFESLATTLSSAASGSSQNDHLWHEFKTVRAATPEELVELSVWGSTEDLLAIVDRVGKWNLTNSPNYAAFANVISTTDVMNMIRNRGL